MTKIGWDIGGAHVKAAVINSSGTITHVLQQACPLWKGLEHLRLAVGEILAALPKGQHRHAITMTGELVDLFANRDDGVKQIIATMSQLLGSSEQRIFVGGLGLLDVSEIDAGHYQAIASLNWLASAAFAAQEVGNGLFVDIGSTTTDILLLDKGQVLAKGHSDYQRLVSKELVYTGIVRTPVMAVAQSVADMGHEVGLMAEYFATMADVYRLTGELNEAHDQAETADGAEKSTIASGRRLARMLGCDFYPEEMPRWQAVAGNLRSQQLQKIQSACAQVLAACGTANAPIVGAGVGRFLLRQMAQDMARPYVDFSDLCGQVVAESEITPADCAPAVALAYLL
jgi:probable H4MPT-linked C1 transfer pathway protein